MKPSRLREPRYTATKLFDRGLAKAAGRSVVCALALTLSTLNCWAGIQAQSQEQSGTAATSQAADATRQPAQELKKLNFEDLFNIEVTTVSRTQSTVGQSPAAVFVITPEMIRRSGATTIAESLRMVPGIEVTRGVENGGWLISMRGFNAIPSTKLLVLIDGRSVYNPFSAGVFWDVQDTLMEDIERIEVIRGPGGSLWGANAVNGIVNVITKSAKDTPGALLMGGGGTYERAFGGARYGWKLGQDAHARFYVKPFRRGELRLPDGSSAADPWQLTQTGFRTDWQARGDDHFTFQGDLYDGDRRNPDRVDLFGANVLGRWTHKLKNDGELQIQAYYDRADRTIPSLVGVAINTGDVDFQYRSRWGSRHSVTWGLGYRAVFDKADSTPVLVSPPKTGMTNLYSAFAQDQIELLDRERLRLTIGSKFEHNIFTGFEAQPSARLMWRITPRQSAWAAVSRAVRTPTLQENDSMLRRGPVTTFGNSNFASEEMLAYELGYRAIPVSWLTLDVATFYNEYDQLASLERLTPTTTLRDNKLTGGARGAEFSTTWKPADWFAVQGAYSYLHLRLRADADSTDATSANAAGNDPQQQLYLHGSLDLPRHVQIDGTVRYVDRLPNLDVARYVAADARLAWRPTEHLELAVVGQNLFDHQHPEFATPALRKKIPRGVFGNVTRSF